MLEELTKMWMLFVSIALVLALIIFCQLWVAIRFQQKVTLSILRWIDSKKTKKEYEEIFGWTRNKKVKFKWSSEGVEK